MIGGELIVNASREQEFDLLRRPVAHKCVACGFTENIVPPCGKGVTYWQCKCGAQYRMQFEGMGLQCGETIAKGV